MLSSEDENVALPNVSVKRRKPGLIYLSYIPKSMNVSKIREYFMKYGQIGRVYLKPANDNSAENRKRKHFLTFSEGWIEFESKRKAKYVHEFVNNTYVGGERRNPDYYSLWNIKYLPRVKWEHLTLRLNYQREMYKKQMLTEVSQVNKECDHYLKARRNSKKKLKLHAKNESTTTNKEEEDAAFNLLEKKNNLSKSKTRKKEEEDASFKLLEKKNKSKSKTRKNEEKDASFKLLEKNKSKTTNKDAAFKILEKKHKNKSKIKSKKEKDAAFKILLEKKKRRKDEFKKSKTITDDFASSIFVGL